MNMKTDDTPTPPTNGLTPPTREERLAASYKWSCHLPALIDNAFGDPKVDLLLGSHLARDMADWRAPAEYESSEKDISRFRTLPFIEREYVVQRIFIAQLKAIMTRHYRQVVSRAECAAIVAICHSEFVTADPEQHSGCNCGPSLTDLPF